MRRRRRSRPPIEPMAGTDRYRVNLGTAERQVLSSLPLQLAELLGTGDPSLVRLFPPAYVGEDSLQEEYEELMGTQLEKHHRSCLESLAESATAAELTKDQLEKWLAAINDIRLVLGTRLNVSEEIEEVSDTDPSAPAYATYHYLSWLAASVVDILAKELPQSPEPGGEAASEPFSPPRQ